MTKGLVKTTIIIGVGILSGVGMGALRSAKTSLVSSYGSHVQRMSHQFIREFPTTKLESEEEIREFVEKEGEVLKSIYKTARAKYRRARAELVKILEVEFEALTTSELEALNSGADGLVPATTFTVRVRIRGSTYSVRVEYKDWPELFPATRFGFTPTDSLKDYLWEVCTHASESNI